MISIALSRRLVSTRLPKSLCSVASSDSLNQEIFTCSFINKYDSNLNPTAISHYPKRFFSTDLPYHLIVGMPALSPTMEQGTIAEWSVAAGDGFAAGDTIAEIETDKASIAFEAQDDAYVAKILVEAGTADIPVGTPIMVTVEEEEHVAAFKDFVVEASAASAPATADTAVVAESAPPPTPPVTEAPKPVAESSPAPPPVAAAPSPPPPPTPEIIISTETGTTLGPIWGEHAKVKSPLKGILSKTQQEYLNLYGATGQTPI